MSLRECCFLLTRVLEDYHQRDIEKQRHQRAAHYEQATSTVKTINFTVYWGCRHPERIQRACIRGRCLAARIFNLSWEAGGLKMSAYEVLDAPDGLRQKITLWCESWYNVVCYSRQLHQWSIDVIITEHRTLSWQLSPTATEFIPRSFGVNYNYTLSRHCLSNVRSECNVKWWCTQKIIRRKWRSSL